MFQAYIYNYSKVNPVAVNGVPLQLPVVTSNGVLKVPRTIGMGLDCDAYAVPRTSLLNHLAANPCVCCYVLSGRDAQFTGEKMGNLTMTGCVLPG